MFCPNCGFKNPDVACFCAKCGARLMYVGKEKCEYLKSIRDRIAKENNIPYESSPCIHGENDLEAVNASPGDNLQETFISPWNQPSGFIIGPAGIPAEPIQPIRDSLLTRIKKAFGK